MTFSVFISQYGSVIAWVGGSLIALAGVYGLIEVVKEVIKFMNKL